MRSRRRTARTGDAGSGHPVRRPHPRSVVPPLEFGIRKATMADYEALGAIFEEVDILHRRAMPDVFQSSDGPAHAEDYIASIIDSDDSVVLVAVVKGRVVGAAHVVVRETPDIPIIVPRRFGVIDSIAVRKPLRRKGIGRALLVGVTRWLADKGVHQLELSVYDFNRSALGFYRQQGFRTISRRMQRGT